MSIAIEINNYTKIIKKNMVLSDINLILEAGKVYGLYGHNGSGKSMLLRAMAGLINPTSGSITVFGKQLCGTFPDSMGLIIENVGFWPYYTGFENLNILASIKKVATTAKIRNAMERVGLSPDDKRLFSKYSLGMKQRLGIAQAIMENPDLILLDEPTNALDDQGIKLIYDVIKEENNRGATIIIASHNKEDLATLCHECFKMADGKISKGDLFQ